jgi:hypothetical protein
LVFKTAGLFSRERYLRTLEFFSVLNNLYIFQTQEKIVQKMGLKKCEVSRPSGTCAIGLIHLIAG